MIVITKTNVLAICNSNDMFHNIIAKILYTLTSHSTLWEDLFSIGEDKVLSITEEIMRTFLFSLLMIATQKQREYVVRTKSSLIVLAMAFLVIMRTIVMVISYFSCNIPPSHFTQSHFPLKNVYSIVIHSDSKVCIEYS